MRSFKKHFYSIASISIVFFLFLLSWIPKFNRSHYFKQLGMSCIKPFLKRYNIKLSCPAKPNELPKRYIMVANHVSALDILILLQYFPDLYVVADIKHQKIPVFGRLVKFANTIPIDRKSSLSKMSSIENLVNQVAYGNNILIFPQGLTSDKIENFSAGAFITAKKTLVPILPVFITFNPLEIFHYKTGEPYAHALEKLTTVTEKSAHVRIFPAISPQHYETPQALCDHVFQLYKEWYAKFQKSEMKS